MDRIELRGTVSKEMSNSQHTQERAIQSEGVLARIVLAATAFIAVVLATSILAAIAIVPYSEIEILPIGTTPEQVDQFLKSLDDVERAKISKQLRLEIQARPLHIEPVKKLAALAQTGRQVSDGSELVMLAANRVRRDVALQSSALKFELEQKNYAAAIYRLGIIFQTQPQKQAEVMKVLAGLTSPPSQDALAEAIAKNPTWRKLFLIDLTANPNVDIDTIYGLFSVLRKVGSPASQTELRGFLHRLITTGAQDKAYFVWLDSIDEDSLRKAGLVHDGGFDLPLTNQFFSWTSDKVPNVDARIAPRSPGSVDKVLRIEFTPARTNYGNFSQYLKLASGSYVLTGESKVDNLVTPVGLVWRIACTSEAVDFLAETKSVSGSMQWTTFETPFVIPDEGCLTQTIKLQVNAKTLLDTQISGQAQFDNLVIARKKL
jgi:hypothetical protein